MGHNTGVCCTCVLRKEREPFSRNVPYVCLWRGVGVALHGVLFFCLFFFSPWVSLWCVHAPAFMLDNGDLGGSSEWGGGSPPPK